MNPTSLRNNAPMGRLAQNSPAILPWLPLMMACVLETVWGIAPWKTALSFFSLLACIFMVGVSLIVGIVMLIQRKHPLRAVGVLLGSVFLPLLLIVLFFEVLHLDLHLH